MATFYEDIPTFEEFKSDLKSINPDGDLRVAYDRLRWYLDPTNEQLTDDGDQITWSMIRKKYKEHIAWWKHSYGQREEKYIGNEDKKLKKNIYDFIGGGYYNREWIISKGNMERDDYLFGKVSIQYLAKQLNNFKSKFTKQ
jgi:hypothetical protein